MDHPADQTPPPLPQAAPPPPPAATKLPVGIVVTVCVAVALAAGVVSRTVVRGLLTRTPGSASNAWSIAANDFRSPDELMRIGNEKGGLIFRRQIARAAERATKRMVPKSLIVFDEAAVIDDLGTVMRGTVGYRGKTSQSIDEGVHVDGQQRHYFHPQGAVIVDAVCVTSLSDCQERDLLLDAAEEAILGSMNQPGVDALLPPNGRCEVEHKPFAGTLATCQFRDEGLVLSLQKLSLEDTRRAMQKISPPTP